MLSVSAENVKSDEEARERKKPKAKKRRREVYPETISMKRRLQAEVSLDFRGGGKRNCAVKRAPRRGGGGQKPREQVQKIRADSFTSKTEQQEHPPVVDDSVAGLVLRRPESLTRVSLSYRN